MPLNLSIKNVPEALVEALRRRAERNHRSMQGEMMAILEAALRPAETAIPAPEDAPFKARAGVRTTEDALAVLRKDVSRDETSAAGPSAEAARRPGSVLGLVLMLLFGATALAGQKTPPASEVAGTAPHSAEAPWPPVATFSILGYDPETGEVGGAVQSRVFSVGNGVLWAEANVGVVATQAIVDVSYGPQGLALLRAGVAPEAVVARILDDDPDPDPENWTIQGRQFSVMDAQGRVATHTGPRASEWAGHRIAANVSAQGNILAGPAVVDGMVRAFQETPGHLSLRLLAALDAGQAAGGDTRGMQSAAMVIVKEDGGVWLNNDVVLRLQVDDSEQPLVELRRLVEIAAAQRERIRRRREERR